MLTNKTLHPGLDLGLCSELPHVFSSGGFCLQPLLPWCLQWGEHSQHCLISHPGLTQISLQTYRKEYWKISILSPWWAEFDGYIPLEHRLQFWASQLVLRCKSCLMSTRSMVLGWKNSNSHILSKEEWAAPTALILGFCSSGKQIKALHCLFFWNHKCAMECVFPCDDLAQLRWWELQMGSAALQN